MIRRMAISFCIVFVLMVNHAYGDDIMLKQVKKTSGFDVELSGRGFAKPCAKCEVIIDYGRGQRYAAKFTKWSDQKIMASIPDIGLGLKVKIHVKTPKAESNKVGFSIKKLSRPAEKINRFINNKGIDGLALHNYKYSEKMGGRGEDKINVSSLLPKCGKTGYVFDQAAVVYKQQRFGKVNISKNPKSGCIKCPPLRVQWFHEPTGQLEYQVQVYSREIVGACSKLKR